MDLEKFRSRWEDPEFEQKFYLMVADEPPSQLRARLRSWEKRARRWRKINHIIITGLGAGFLLLNGLILFDVLPYRESLLAKLAFIIGLAIVGIGMPRIMKEREKYEIQQLWLPTNQFFAAEQKRMDMNIRLDKRASWVLAAAVTCIGMYFFPLRFSILSRVAYICAVIALTAICYFYNRRKIRQFENARDDLAQRLSNLLRDNQ
jgi:hypothetical protein